MLGRAVGLDSGAFAASSCFSVVSRGQGFSELVSLYSYVMVYTVLEVLKIIRVVARDTTRKGEETYRENVPLPGQAFPSFQVESVRKETR